MDGVRMAVEVSRWSASSSERYAASSRRLDAVVVDPRRPDLLDEGLGVAGQLVERGRSAQDASPSVVSVASPSVPSASLPSVVAAVARSPSVPSASPPSVPSASPPPRPRVTGRGWCSCRRRRAALRGGGHGASLVVGWVVPRAAVPDRDHGRTHGTRPAPRRPRLVQEPPAAGDGGGLGAAGGAELAEDVGDVHRDGLRADEQLLADLAVGPALGDQGEDLGLARGQRVRRTVGAGGGRPERPQLVEQRLGAEPVRGLAGQVADLARRRRGRRSRAGCRPGSPGRRRARRRGRSRRTAARRPARCRPGRPAAGRRCRRASAARSVSASSRFIQARPSGPQWPEGSVYFSSTVRPSACSRSTSASVRRALGRAEPRQRVRDRARGRPPPAGSGR